MPENRIADLFQIQSRYLRSVHLERDFADTSALQGYVLTDYAKNNLERMAAGLAETSGQRAWRITGDYGSGKSSFALVLAHLFAGRYEGLSPKIKKIIDFNKIGVSVPHFLPVLVTGSREPLSIALLRSLRNALQRYSERGRLPKVIDKIQVQLDRATIVDSDDNVVELITEANAYVKESGKGAGLLIILDELGKFLEFASLHPDRQDVYFLQKLAEAAMRSGKNPLFIVGLLHQGFNTYADQMSQSAQKEWEKVAGRFEELFFDQPLEQMAGLVANALNLKIKQLPRDLAAQAEFDMESALNLGWYGSAFNRKTMIANAASLYPLHPSVLPVLVKLFSRFGQNERSLFSFLLSNEPFGLQDFASRSIGEDSFYRLYNLYDYARTAFGHRLSIQSYRSHWNHIDSVIESFHPTDKIELRILKTVGLLNLLDTSNLLASEEAVLMALTGENAADTRHAKAVLQKLQKVKKVLYNRGASGGYCLWPHTSVNIEKIYDDASKALPIAPRISSIIAEYLETRPLVARRHYIKTGNLRHFEVRYAGAADLSNSLFDNSDSSDGLIVIPLCETDEERRKALKFAKSIALADRPEVLVAIPEPLGSLSGLVQEAQRWQWIEKNTTELNDDRYAAEEVSRQITASRKTLEKRIQSFIGLRQFAERTTLQWFCQGTPVVINNGRDLLSRLSDSCDIVYGMAPHIHNELVNRRSLSSAAVGARMRLIERIFKYASEPLLGMDKTKKPPEMSIYLSVLREAGMHQESGDSCRILVPEEKKDICIVRPSLERIKQLMEENPDSRIKISDIFMELRKQPYGVRDGIVPLLLAVFAKVYEHDLAFYENGAFMRHIEGDDFQRIVKAPETFEMQYCRITGVRADLFDKLLNILELQQPGKRKADILDVVQPLCQFTAKLPSYTHKTKKLSPVALAVRAALLAAKEPANLLFHDLPKACGCDAFSDKKNASEKEVQTFISTLKNALDELKGAFPELQERMKSHIMKSFEMPGTFSEVRTALAEISETILVTITEPRLKSFCMRLADSKLSESEWLESMGSLICSKPPSRWYDTDEDLFSYETNLLASRFKRVESISFKSKGKNNIGSAIRIAITQSDGTEVEQVVYLSKDEEAQADEIEAEVTAVIKKGKRVGLAAASRVFWKMMSDKEK
ncbi:MAG: hypothetical protein C0402_08270 [Thermodesulfovibrio sp.]|nr:hypothetical protein [Thermodesulfovibrio sp.]